MLHLWPQLHREPGPFVMPRLLLVESASHFLASEWDALSGSALKRKLHPGMRAQSGMRFPVEGSSGKFIPEYGSRLGRTFHLKPQVEAVSRNARPEWDALSGLVLNRKLRPGISLQSGMPFPAEPSGGKYIPELTLRVGHGFRIEPQRKLRPSLSVYSGMQFPLKDSTGKPVPFRDRIPGCAFR